MQTLISFPWPFPSASPYHSLYRGRVYWGCAHFSLPQYFHLPNVTYFGLVRWALEKSPLSTFILSIIVCDEHFFLILFVLFYLCLIALLLLLVDLRSGLLNFTCMSSQSLGARCWASIYALFTCLAFGEEQHLHLHWQKRNRFEWKEIACKWQKTWAERRSNVGKFL